MGAKSGKSVEESFFYLKKMEKKNASEAARKYGIHVTTLYRHKPYIEWRKSQKGNKP